MYLQKGLGKGFAVPLFTAAMIVSGANAALVSYSTVVTNNTLSEQTYEFSKSYTLTGGLGITGGSGSLAILVTDIRGGGAYVKAFGANAIYTSFVNGVQVATITPTVPATITASQFGQGSYSQQFTPKNYGVLGNINDIIQTQLKFILSAGDQAVISSTFEVVAFTPIPAPGSLALICIASGLGLRGRRRASY